VPTFIGKLGKQPPASQPPALTQAAPTGGLNSLLGMGGAGGTKNGGTTTKNGGTTGGWFGKVAQTIAKKRQPDPGLQALQDTLTQLALGGVASPEQQAIINQLQEQQFQLGAQDLQEQAKQLSSMLSGSAAARGLGRSSIGGGQQTVLGQALLKQLGQLRGGLSVGGLQQMLQLPFQSVGALMPLLLSQMDIGARAREAERARAAQGGGWLGNLLGTVGGMFFDPTGGVLTGGLKNILNIGK
jgi:hypothetical protein